MRLSKKLIGLALAFVLAVTAAGSAYATVDSEKKRLKQLEKQKESAAEQGDKLKKSKKEAEAYIKAMDKQLTEVTLQIVKTEKQLGKTKQKISKTEKKLEKAQESINIQYSDMKLRIKYMYENGDTQMLDLILNSKSISDLLNKAEYITELSQYDRKMLDKLKDTKQQIADAKTVLEAEKTRLTKLQSGQKADKNKLEQLSANKQKELDTYKDLIAANEGAADMLEDEITAQEAKIAKAEQESIAAAQRAAQNRANNNTNDIIKNSKPGAGGCTWPVPGYKTISSDYGDTDGRSSGHKGIDIAAPSGTAIVAAKAGQVAWANYSSSAGNWIGINHGNGVYTVYMHMSAMAVSSGANVSAGQVIGYVGTTGNSTGNHLHFGVRVNGAWTNPWNYL